MATTIIIITIIVLTTTRCVGYVLVVERSALATPLTRVIYTTSEMSQKDQYGSTQ